MKKVFTLVLALTFFIPSISSAATLSQSQVSAIIALLYAFNVDQQTILSVQKALTPQSVSPTQNVQTQSTQAPVIPQLITPSTPSVPAVTATPTATPPISLARIDIISPKPGMGVGRKHTTSPELDNGGKGNPMNEMVIAGVLYGDDGRTAVRDAVMTITATDSTQNTTMNGTGEVHPVYVDGYKTIPPIYTYYYVFKTAGEHTITFSANGVSKSVTVQVAE